ncbi:MAG: indole-3-glycerol phosphate synthase TrpC [bacterium]
MTILDDILACKREEVARAKAARSAERIEREARSASRPPRSLIEALRETPAPAVIAEVKRRSPSKGLIRPDFDPVAIARAYAGAGAAAISVLTDESFFGGSLRFLSDIRQAVDLPLLRKDFVIDAYQIDEARIAGADAVLLIVAALEPTELKRLHDHAEALGLEALVEVHDEAEWEVADGMGARLIGVNNRDLRTFAVDLATTERIATRAAGSGVLLVAESGISTYEDVERLERAGAGGYLVGESLMRQPDPGKALEGLRRPS